MSTSRAPSQGLSAAALLRRGWGLVLLACVILLALPGTAEGERWIRALPHCCLIHRKDS